MKEIIGGDLQLERTRLIEIGEILLDQLKDRDLREVDLLRPGEVEQQVERPLPAVEAQRQLVAVADRALVEILVHRAIIPRVVALRRQRHTLLWISQRWRRRAGAAAGV